MRILVTGASGFVGRPALRKLLESPAAHHIQAWGRGGSAPTPHARLQWVSCDLRNPASYEGALRLFRPEIVLHLAWEGIPDFSTGRSLANLETGVRFADFLLDLECCKKVIVAGSCFEYDQLVGACSESTLGQPKDAFTWAKHSLRSYLALKCAARKVVLAWGRIFYVYGPNQRSGSLVPTLLDHLRRGLLPALKTPQNANDFVYVDDVAEWYVRAIEQEITSGIFNVGSGRSTTVLEMCRIAERTVLESDSLTQALREATAETPATVDFWADLGRTNQHLSWQPRIDENEGIRLTWESLG